MEGDYSGTEIEGGETGKAVGGEWEIAGAQFKMNSGSDGRSAGEEVERGWGFTRSGGAGECWCCCDELSGREFLVSALLLAEQTHGGVHPSVRLRWAPPSSHVDPGQAFRAAVMRGSTLSLISRQNMTFRRFYFPGYTFWRCKAPMI
jgi:hypothetical protein